MKELLFGRFHLRRQDFILDVELHIPARGVTGIYGPSGAGKTTLLRCLAGLERAPDGMLMVDGDPWQDESKGLFLPPYRRDIGMVFQEPRLFSHLSVRQNLEFGRRRKQREATRVSMDYVVEILGIASILNRKPGQLSGGEKQRVAIGRALLTSPKLILMDEPMTGLDRARKSELMPFLEKLHDTLEIPLILVSHQMGEIISMADTLLLMESGKITASGPIAQILTRLDLPLASDAGAVTMVEGVVKSVDETYQIVDLDTPLGLLAFTGKDFPIGQRLRAHIRARNVSISLERPRKSSILNILPAKVVEVSPLDGQDNIKLNINGEPLLARISRKSSHLLGLKPGMAVYAQIKSVAIDHNTPNTPRR